jgi:hypothetical protein
VTEACFLFYIAGECGIKYGELKEKSVRYVIIGQGNWLKFHKNRISGLYGVGCCMWKYVICDIKFHFIFHLHLN